MDMDWKEIKIYAEHKDIENLSAALIGAGIDGLVINDPDDIRLFAAQKSDSWDYIDDELLKKADDGRAYISVYISEDEDGAALAESVNEALVRLRGMGVRLELKAETVREEDWANEWKKYFKPLKIGEKLIIKPTWIELSEEEVCGRTVIEIDPENSFGTGRHETTQLCLELMEKYVKKGDEIIDLGCGSGIIFIAGLLLGAAHAVGVDITDDAVKISTKNALQNGITKDRFSTACGYINDDGNPWLYLSLEKEYDIVAANIVADVLLSFRSVFKNFTAPNGTLILSGIIDDRLEEVVNAVKADGFTIIEQRNKKGWNALAAKKSVKR